MLLQNNKMSLTLELIKLRKKTKAHAFFARQLDCQCLQIRKIVAEIMVMLSPTAIAQIYLAFRNLNSDLLKFLKNMKRRRMHDKNSLALFPQKFRQNNGFTKEITK